jgi:hypothetical protein
MTAREERKANMSDVLETVEPVEKNEDDIFVFVIHGFAPEFYDNLAFRIDKSGKPRRTKDVICPYCKRKFETVDANIKIEVFRYSKKSEEICHSFRACKMCHKVVGIKRA